MNWKHSLPTYAVAFAVILALNFLLPRMMPGDPLQAIYGDDALLRMTPQLKARIVERFALDKSLAHQFGAYLSGLARGDLGYSYYFAAPVLKVIMGRLPWTLLLVGSALVVSTILGVLMGIESGWRRGGRLDRGMLTGLVALNGFPDFFLGMVLLLVFSATIGLFPLAGALTPYSGYRGAMLVLDALHHLALPLTALTMGHLAGGYLLTRNTMITVLKQPFMLAARAKGLSERTQRYRHAGRNSMLPVLTRTGLWMGRLVTGVLFTEVVFAYPGLGQLTYDALTARDYPVLQGVLFMVTVTVLLANFVVDLLYPKLDPRVRNDR